MNNDSAPESGWWKASDGKWYPPGTDDPPAPPGFKRDPKVWIAGIGVVATIAIGAFIAFGNSDEVSSTAENQAAGEKTSDAEAADDAADRSTRGGFSFTEGDVSWNGIVDGFLTWDEADGRCVAVVGTFTPSQITNIQKVSDGVFGIYLELVYDEGNLGSEAFSRCNEEWLKDAGYGYPVSAEVEVGEAFQFFEVFEQPDHVDGQPHSIQVRTLLDEGIYLDAIRLETLPGTNQPPGPELKVIRQFSVDDMIDEDAILGVDLDLYGMALYDLIVPSGKHLNLYGQVLGDLLVEEGGSAEIYGIVSGTVSAQGSVTVHGEAYRAEGPGLVVAAGGKVQLRG